MKKILFGLVGILLTAGLVGGSAYALFSDTAAVKGIKITSGNAELQVALDKAEQGFDTVNTSLRDTVYEPNYYIDTAKWLQNLYPGKEDWGYFRLRNNSLSNIPLKLTAKLTAANGWDSILKDQVSLKITNETGTNDLTPWYTLNQWNASYRTIEDIIPYNKTETYRLYVKLNSSAGNTVAELSLSSVEFEILGTQQ